MTIPPIDDGEGGSRFNGRQRSGNGTAFSAVAPSKSGPALPAHPPATFKRKSALQCGQMKKIVERCNNPTGAGSNPSSDPNWRDTWQIAVMDGHVIAVTKSPINPLIFRRSCYARYAAPWPRKILEGNAAHDQSE